MVLVGNVPAWGLLVAASILHWITDRYLGPSWRLLLLTTGCTRTGLVFLNSSSLNPFIGISPRFTITPFLGFSIAGTQGPILSSLNTEPSNKHQRPYHIIPFVSRDCKCMFVLVSLWLGLVSKNCPLVDVRSIAIPLTCARLSPGNGNLIGVVYLYVFGLTCESRLC